MKILLLVAMVLSLVAAGPDEAIGAETAPLQRDWMVNLVDGMGWSFGLPGDPADADYLRILEGRRTFRIEAEQAHHPADMVAAKDFTSFGPFSDKGWLSGIATATTAHLHFTLPLSGSYQLTAALRLPGFRLRIGERTFTADGENQFTFLDLGKIDLPAGDLEILIEIPPNGGVDYIELKAPNLRPIAPLQGWAPDRPLTLEDLAVTTARVLGLESALHPLEPVLTVEAESAGPLAGVEITDIRRLGEPSGGRWIRAGNLPAEVEMTFSVPAAGSYTLQVRGTAESALTGLLNEHYEVPLNFPPYLDTVLAGDFYLERGGNTLSLTLPPHAGIDSLLLQPRSSRGEDYLRLAGLEGADARPGLEQMNRLLALLAALGPSR